MTNFLGVAALKASDGLFPDRRSHELHPNLVLDEAVFQPTGSDRVCGFLFSRGQLSFLASNFLFRRADTGFADQLRSSVDVSHSVIISPPKDRTSLC